MFSYDVKIPKERIAVLIGEHGKKKRELEEQTRTRIIVDSKEGDVNITGEDGLQLYIAQNIVKAIARGFNPDIAQRLLKQDYAFELIDLSKISSKKNQQLRLKGRVIGTEGKSRNTIEELTECKLSVYGKTIAIIGPIDTIAYGKRAVEKLLEGSTHSSVYRSLERQKRERKRAEIIGTHTPIKRTKQ